MLVLDLLACLGSLIGGEVLAAPAPLVHDAAPLGRRLAVEGHVVDLDGSPAAGAVVVTSAGGRAVVAEDGRFRIEVEVPGEAGSLQVTAVGAGASNRIASTGVALVGTGPLVAIPPLVLEAGAACSPGWLPQLGPLVEPPNGRVLCMTAHDDGGGTALYVGGDFTVIGGTFAARVARWDGVQWSGLGSGTTGSVATMVGAELPNGPALCIGGAFLSAGGAPANRVALWQGGQWKALGSGCDDSVLAVAVYDDGGGVNLYAGGLFENAGGQQAVHVARWNGSAWSDLDLGVWSSVGGSGFSGQVDALEVWDDGSGSALYVGGNFNFAGSVSARNVARWNGSVWATLGAGLDEGGLSSGVVRDFTVFDDGSGPALYAGGEFTESGGVPVNGVARWDGLAWQPVGGGIDSSIDADDPKVIDLAVHDAGNGPKLYAVGNFTSAEGAPAGQAAVWDRTTWSAVGPDLFAGNLDVVVCALLSYPFDGGPQLLVGGDDFVLPDTLQKLGSVGWTAVSSAPSLPIEDLVVHDAGSGPELYAVGSFNSIGGVNASGVARWNGNQWASVGGGVTGVVVTAASFDDGTGPALYVAGTLSSAGGSPVQGVARWDGTSWSQVGAVSAFLFDLEVVDFGAGSQLVLGGQIAYSGSSGGGVLAWDGNLWQELGQGVTGGGVNAIAEYDDGSGPALYVGGTFTQAGGAPANRVARWDGVAWSSLGAGVGGVVLDLEVFDGGGGPELVVGGQFTQAGGAPAARIARWNGSQWSPLGAGLPGPFTNAARALVVHDDGSGPALYVGGAFATAGSTAAASIARWDGTAWSALGSGVSGFVHALASFDGALQAAGPFTVQETDDSYFGVWGCAASGGYVSLPGCFANPALLTSDDPGMPLGGSTLIELTASAPTDGLALLYGGAGGVDGSGCGLLLPGIGEVFTSVAPLPALLAQVPATAGAAAFDLPVPFNPLLAGKSVVLQGFHVDLSAAPAQVELSQGLVGTFF